MNHRVAMMYVGLVHMTISIEAVVLVIVATLVGHKHRRMVLEEPALVVVAVHMDCP